MLSFTSLCSVFRKHDLTNNKKINIHIFMSINIIMVTLFWYVIFCAKFLRINSVDCWLNVIYLSKSHWNVLKPFIITLSKKCYSYLVPIFYNYLPGNMKLINSKNKPVKTWRFFWPIPRNQHQIIFWFPYLRLRTTLSQQLERSLFA